MRDFKATRFRRTFGCSRSQAVVIHHQLCPTLEFKDVLAFLRWAKTYPPNYRFPGFTDRTGSIKRIWKIANVIAQNAPAYWSTTYPNVRTYPYNLAAWTVDGIHFQLPRSERSEAAVLLETPATWSLVPTRVQPVLQENRGHLWPCPWCL